MSSEGKDAPVVEEHSEKSLDAGDRADDLALSAADERRLKRKIDWNIVPYCSLLYLLSFLDRVNIGQARTAGLEADLKLVRNQYDIALTVFFVSYVAFEVPSNLLLRRFQPHRIITLSMLAWAVVMTLMGLVRNFPGLVAARFMLGLAEGGLFPGINLLLTHWYTRNESNIVVSIFFAGATLAGAWGGLLAYGIRHMAGVGGKNGWSWIFILEGLLTFLCALPAWWLVPDFPEDAKFLTERERAQWMARLRRSQGLTGAPVAFTWEQVRRAFADWRTYVYSLMYFFVAGPFYSLSLFTPSIIKGLGATNANANLLSVPPYALGFVSTLLFALASDRLCVRGPFIVGGMGLVIVGYAVLLAPVSFAAQYVALHLCVIGCCPCIATCITWVGNNFGPTYTRATAMGVFFATGNAAGILASNVYPARDGPRYIRGHAVALACAGLAILCSCALMADNARQNRARDGVHGRVRARGKESVDVRTGRAVDAFDRARWGLPGDMADEAVVLLGDRHPAYRYIL